MPLLLAHLGKREGAIALVEDDAANHGCKVQQPILGLVEMLRKVLFLDLSVLFVVGCPLIWLALNPIRSLVIETLIVGLENASMPKTKVSFHSGAHLSLVLCSVLFF